MTTRRKQQLAFTMLELCITLLIFSIITLLASLSFAGSIRKTRLSKEANEIATEIEALSLRSIQSEKAILFRTNKTYYELRSQGVLIGTRTLTQPIHFSNPGSVQILLSQTASVTPATILITEGKQTCAVIVSLRGRTRTKCY